MDTAVASADSFLTALLTGAATIPVAVLTGFLGAGKTTLLNAAMQGPAAAETVVLVNEFGEVGIDNLMVEEIVENVVLLPSGCLCCAVRGDLVDALRDLFTRLIAKEVPFFRQVLIETSGLAEPAPIVHTLLTDVALQERYRLASVTTVVDASLGAGQLRAHRESTEQVAVADRLVLSKLDLATAEDADALVRTLHHLNAGAPIIASRDVLAARDAVSSTFWPDPDDDETLSRRLVAPPANLPYAPSHGRAHGHGHAGADLHGFETFTLIATAPLDWSRLSDWLQSVLAEHGPKILRVKGVLDIAGEVEPVVVHGVQHIFYPATRLSSWAKLQRRSVLVFITQSLSQADVERGFAGVVRNGSPVH